MVDGLFLLNGHSAVPLVEWEINIQQGRATIPHGPLTENRAKELQLSFASASSRLAVRIFQKIALLFCFELIYSNSSKTNRRSKSETNRSNSSKTNRSNSSKTNRISKSETN
jgi:hypothetical protein